MHRTSNASCIKRSMKTRENADHQSTVLDTRRAFNLRRTSKTAHRKELQFGL